MKAERTGHVRNRITFRGTSTTEPSRDEIAEAQKDAGYHPAGYGGPTDIVIKRQDGMYVVTWQCWDSCE